MGRGFAQTKVFHAATPIGVTESSNIDVGYFRRIEDKYLISNSAADGFIDDLKNTMPISFPDPKTLFTFIKSCYLDSASLDFFQDHFRGLAERNKVRLRQYAPNGHWDDVALLEIKQKKSEESKKVRFFIAPYAPTKGQGPMPCFDSAELAQLNPNLKNSTLQKRIDKANGLIREYGLAPKINIVYQRLAFQRDDVRMTLDTNIDFTLEDVPSSLLVQMLKGQKELWDKAEQLCCKFDAKKHLVLEVKHQGSLPRWASDLLEKWQLEQTNFSKYCWAMACALQNHPLLKVA